ncbi:hypothetical protein [Mesorhizobium xinjiangense]|uniref:hypothetical protein n=1 Tax=Mesorhizobium xinjiangense TaxID=2678685 RepID=UPI0012EE37B7|nr:hypothetical protein [Mesorhizobium xinjiangense]
MREPSKERATFSIDAAVKEQLDRDIPKSKRSGFVELAIADALRKVAVARLRQTLDEIQGTSSGEEDSVELLRRLRREREAYQVDRHARPH